MKSLCDLEERHGVNLGNGYKNYHACATFVKFIAKEQQHILLENLSAVKCLSIQADGSTDVGNVEDELFTVQYFDPKKDDGKVHVRNKFFCVRQPRKGDAQSLFERFKAAMEFVGIVDWEMKLIGFGCDGTNVNIAAGGLRGFLEKSVPWIVVFWYLRHAEHLEKRKELLLPSAHVEMDDLVHF